MAQVVQFTINLNGNAEQGVAQLDKSVSRLDTDMARLQGTVARTENKFDKLGRSSFNLKNIFGVVLGVVGRLNSAMQKCTEGNRAQQEAEAKLAQVMRNTMGAGIDELNAIKDLTAAQQKLGVIGDEVQLAGAQELGTYIEKADSLKKLIPVMNDMLAQQYGLNATQEQAVTIGSMMGKVLEGQTGALSRYGYKFDKAQEKLLKYGTEEQKVAALAEVIAESVGGMNEALANTPEGKLKQAQNRLGDIKETVGNIATNLAAAVLPALEPVFEMAERISEKVRGLASKLTSSPLFAKAAEAVRMILTELEGLTAKLLSAFRPVLNALVSGGGRFKEILDGTWGVIVEKVHPALQKVTQSIARIVGGVIDWITSSEITMDIFRQGWIIIGAVSDIVAFIFNVLEKIINYVIIPIIRLIDMAYARVKSVIAAILGAMQPVVDFIKSLYDGIARVVRRIVDGIAQILSPLIKFWESISGNRIEIGGGVALPKWEGGTMEELVHTVNDGLDTHLDGGGGSGEAKKSATATATGGTRSTTVNINLGKMVENINFNGGYEENEQDIEQRLAAMLSRILGMAEATAG